MATIIRKVFFKKERVSIALVETKDREKTPCEIFLAFVISKGQEEFDLWRIPANRILRAKELLDILKSKEYSAEGIANLWKMMSRDPLDVRFETDANTKNSSLVEHTKRVIELTEELITLGVNPSLDELKEILSNGNFDSNLLVVYLEKLLREGTSARMIRLRNAPEFKPKRKNPWRILLPEESNYH